MFIVVRISGCHMSFCCTAIGVPTASSHARYVCRKAFVPRCRYEQPQQPVEFPPHSLYEYGCLPVLTGLANAKSFGPANCVASFHDCSRCKGSLVRVSDLREPSVLASSARCSTMTRWPSLDCEAGHFGSPRIRFASKLKTFYLRKCGRTAYPNQSSRIRAEV